MLDDLLFSVTRGNPTAAEVAALTAVLLAAQPAAPPGSPGVASAWARSGRPGGAHGSWRSSALPR